MTQEIIERQTALVTYDDSLLGKLTLDKEYGWFETKIIWMGKEINLRLTLDGDNITIEELLPTAYALYNNQKEWDEKLRRFTANEMLETKNDNWLDEDEEELTTEQFMERIQPETLEVRPEEGFSMWYDDGDIFWGHAICVDGNLTEGLKDAEMMG